MSELPNGNNNEVLNQEKKELMATDNESPLKKISD